MQPFVELYGIELMNNALKSVGSFVIQMYALMHLGSVSTASLSPSFSACSKKTEESSVLASSDNHCKLFLPLSVTIEHKMAKMKEIEWITTGLGTPGNIIFVSIFKIHPGGGGGPC